MPAPRFLAPLLLALTLAFGCKGEPRAMVVEIDVDGMTCDSCVQAITYEVGRLEGVASVEVDLEAGKATVRYAEGEVELAAIERTIEKIGYEAELGPAKPASE